MSQIRTRAELERAWLNKKINYQKDRIKVYEYTYEIFIKELDLNILRFDLNNTDSLESDNRSIDQMSADNMRDLGKENPKTSNAFDIVLMHPFSHDAVLNKKANTKIQVDWGDGTKDVYKSGEVNFFPFSDVATVYQSDANNGFMFNPKVNDELYAGRQSYYNINGDTYGTYIAQKSIESSKIKRYKSITNDKHHMIHKYDISNGKRSFKIKIRSTELVAPMLVLKRVLYNVFPFKDKIYPRICSAVPGRQKVNDLDAMIKVVDCYNMVRNKQFLKDQINGVGNLLTENGLSRESRHVLMRSSMVVLNSFIPVAYSIDGTFPPAFYGNIADPALNTYIEDSVERLEEIKDIYINNKPDIRNVSRRHLYNKLMVMDGIKNYLSNKYPSYGANTDAMINELDDINTRLKNTFKRDYLGPETWTKFLNGAGITQEAQEIDKTEEYHRNTRYIDGLKHRGNFELNVAEDYKYGNDKSHYLYNLYEAIGEQHRDAFIVNQRDLDGERIGSKGVSINPFMYLPSRDAVNVLTNLAFESEGSDGVRYIAPKNYFLSLNRLSDGTDVVTRASNTSAVIWDEVHNIYMGAFIDKIKVTGIPIYMYKLKKDDWFRNFTSSKNESLEVYIKRIFNSIPDAIINGSKYKSAKDVYMNRGAWFYNGLQPNTPEVKTTQEIVLDLYLKGFIDKTDVEELYIEIPLTILNPFQNVISIGDRVFREMQNVDRLDGFFCNMGKRLFIESLDAPSKRYYDDTDDIGGKCIMNLRSLPKNKIKKMSYLFRFEACGFYVGKKQRQLPNFRYWHDKYLLSAIPPSVEEVDNVLSFSDLNDDDTTKLDKPITLFDNTLPENFVLNNETLNGIYDRKLRIIKNLVLFCRMIPPLDGYKNKRSWVSSSLDNTSILAGWRHLEEVNGVFCFCNVYNNNYITIRDIALRPKDSTKYFALNDNYMIIPKVYVDVVPKPIKLSRLIDNCNTIADIIMDQWCFDNIPKYYNSDIYNWPNKADTRTIMYEPNRSERVLQCKFSPFGKKYKFIDVVIEKRYVGTENKLHSATYEHVKDYDLKPNHLIMWDTFFERDKVNSFTTYHKTYLMFISGLSDVDEVKKYGLGFLFIEKGTHYFYKWENDDRVRFSSLNNMFEGFSRTYSLHQNESGELTMCRTDGLIQQTYQHCYLDGYHKGNELDSPYYTPVVDNKYRNRINYPKNNTYDRTYVLPRCNYLVFGRWNTPMGWMFLSGALDDPANANYKEMWNSYGLNGKFEPGCDLTNLEGLFYNVGPLATDLYPQMEIHDYDDVIDIVTKKGDQTVTMSGDRFGFIAEKDTNVFVKSDKVYNWKNMFKNNTYYYASATDPLAQATSMDSVEPDLARGVSPAAKYNDENARLWRENAAMLKDN